MENAKLSAIVHVYHPDITPEERARRMELIRKAAADLVISTRRNQRMAQQKSMKT